MTQANLEASGGRLYHRHTAMDQAQQVAVRYQYGCQHPERPGGLCSTSDSTANQLRIFRESLKEAATAGDELLPVITPIIGKLNELIQTSEIWDEGTRRLWCRPGLSWPPWPHAEGDGGIITAVKAGIRGIIRRHGTVMAAKTADTIADTAQRANASMAANTAVPPRLPPHRRASTPPWPRTP